MPEYRKNKNSETCHWCSNCSNWPTSDYDISYTKPKTGLLDEECSIKQQYGVCRMAGDKKKIDNAAE